MEIYKVRSVYKHQLTCKLSFILYSSPVSRLPLYQALFASFRRCHTERQVPVLLPGVMMKGQAQVQVTLHHHMCVHICASVAALPPVYFSVLVRVYSV